MSTIMKPKLFLFFQAGFRLVAQDRVWAQVRLCDLARLYTEVLTPWTPHSFFLNSCLRMEDLFNSDDHEESKSSIRFNMGTNSK